MSVLSHPPKERILVVDDIADNSFLLQTLLQAEGYQVDVADSGTAALAKIAANPPDLVLMDVMMPEMDGYEVTWRIRQNESLPFIPVVLVSGYDQPVSGLNVSTEGFIRKPVDLRELLDQVRSLLPMDVLSLSSHLTSAAKSDTSLKPV